jgi:hypothetical protein
VLVSVLFSPMGDERHNDELTSLTVNFEFWVRRHYSLTIRLRLDYPSVDSLSVTVSRMLISEKG